MSHLPDTITLTSAQILYALRLTKGEIATSLYPGVTYDCALPQPWVDRMYERGLDVVPHFVWGYPDEHRVYGVPLPITLEGMMMAAVAVAAGNS